MDIRKIKRGSKFALIGAGKTGVFQTETPRFKNRKSRKESKQELRKLHL